MEHIIGFIGEGGKESGELAAFPVSLRMTGVGTEDKHAAGQQDIQRF